MIFAPPLHRVVEQVDRRVLGAFQFVDAVTELPIAAAAQVVVKGAAIAGGANIPFLPNSVRLRRARSGCWAVWCAPFFDAYSETFENPATPAELGSNSLRLRIAVTDAGPHYLPQDFQFDLPRPFAQGISKPMKVPLFSAPGAPVVNGWLVLRTRVSAPSSERLGGVLVRVFRHPREAGDSPIGQGMSEWRGNVRGEALVVVANIPRFRAGEADEVLARTQEIHFETVRDADFTGAPGQFPDGPKLLAGSASTIVKHRSDAATAILGVVPAAPVKVRAGQEAIIELTTP